MSTALKTAIEMNDPVAAMKAIKAVKNLSRKLAGSTTPLLLACKVGADQVLGLLIEAGAEVKGEDGYVGNHPFCVAADKQQIEVMRLLADREFAPAEAVDHAMFAATLSGREKTIVFLLEYFKLPITQFNLEIATWWKSGRILKIFLDHGADVDTANTGERNAEQKGETAAHDAARGGHADSLQLLISARANLNARDHRGRTPLMELMQRMSELEHDQRVREEVEKRQAASKTLAMDAGNRGSRHGDRGPPEGLQTLHLLLNFGADAALKDNFGNDALDYYQFGNLRNREKADAEVIRILQGAGAKGDAATFALFEALRAKEAAGIKAAIKKGADVNRSAPGHGATPLSWAGDVEAVQILLKAGADPNKASFSTTPLIAAARSGELAIVKALIKAGAEINALERRGAQGEYLTNAWSAADGNNKAEVRDYLKSLGAGNPVLPDWKPLEAGVVMWENFSEVLVKGEPKDVAAAVAKVIGGKITPNAYGRGFTAGKRSHLVIRPKGMSWTNVLQVSPQRGLLDRDEKFLKDLAKASGCAVLLIDYSDTAGAGTIERFLPDGTSTMDQDVDTALVEEIVTELGAAAPAWARKRLAKAKKSSEEADSSQSIVGLAQREKFVLTWGTFAARPGDSVEIAFSGLPGEAFEGAVWVST